MTQTSHPSPQQHAPVFILGLHRSGTTLLYELLAQGHCFNYVTARHVICFRDLQRATMTRDYSRTWLTQKMANANLTDRVADTVAIHPDTPEEYGFILGNHNAGMHITQRNLPLFNTICDVIQRDWATARPLLLKNPWDFANGVLIQQLIPQARFVIIHRDPVAVVNSMWGMTRVIVAQRNSYVAMLSRFYAGAWDGEYPVRVGRWMMDHAGDWMVRRLTREPAAQCHDYVASRAALLPGSFFEIRYEDLCQQPSETMESIYSFLGMSPAAFDVTAHIQPRQGRLTPVVENNRPFIEKAFLRYRQQYGYTP